MTEMRGFSVESLSGYVRSWFPRALPLKGVEIQQDPNLPSYRLRFFIGDSLFISPLPYDAVQRAAHDSDKLARVITAPIVELLDIQRDAEQRGRLAERKELLGKLSKRADYAFKLWRRLRRLQARLRRAARSAA